MTGSKIGQARRSRKTRSLTGGEWSLRGRQVQNVGIVEGRGREVRSVDGADERGICRATSAIINLTARSGLRRRGCRNFSPLAGVRPEPGGSYETP